MFKKRISGGRFEIKTIQSYQILNWDSDFFNFPVAMIIDRRPSLSELEFILSSLKNMGVKLAYWPAEVLWDQEVISKLGGQLFDIKTIYMLDLADDIPEHLSTTEVFEAGGDWQHIASLEKLAIQAGEYSRFALDPNISRAKYTDLYKKWIHKSLSKDIAQEVLLVKQSEKIAGMVTLGEKYGRGDIGLIAVDTEYRGKAFGKKLLYAARSWFSSKGYSEVQVVTQGNNLTACNLYEKCGYSIEKVEYYYHFWLL